MPPMHTRPAGRQTGRQVDRPGTPPHRAHILGKNYKHSGTQKDSVRPSVRRQARQAGAAHTSTRTPTAHALHKNPSHHHTHHTRQVRASPRRITVAGRCLQASPTFVCLCLSRSLLFSLCVCAAKQLDWFKAQQTTTTTKERQF
mmetsp:Transcript_35669/g.88755  ORF Transcript_35669/g.88755 Transcript_35669/m.88755 type:complete len:144 (-) Transcript_35669:804-1235(-)